MSVEGGSIVIDVSEVSVRLKTPPEADVVLRLDISIVGADEELQWTTNGGARMFSTGDVAAFKKEVATDAAAMELAAVSDGGDPSSDLDPSTSTDAAAAAAPEGEEGEEQATPAVPADYIVGFESTLRSSFIDLSAGSLGKVCNTSVVVKVHAVTTTGEEGAEEKEDECLAGFTLALADLLLARGTTLSTAGTALAAESDNVDAGACRVNLRVACDNDLAEYVSGGNVLTWSALSLSSLPAAWGLAFVVEADPKVFHAAIMLSSRTDHSTVSPAINTKLYLTFPQRTNTPTHP